MNTAANYGSTEFADVEFRDADSITQPEFVAPGVARKPVRILARHADGSITSRDVREDPDEIVAAIVEMTPIGGGSQPEFFCHEKTVMDSVSERLIARGYPAVLVEDRGESVVRGTAKANGVLSFDNLRVYGYILLKHLIYLQYPRELLIPLIAFVTKGMLPAGSIFLPKMEGCQRGRSSGSGCSVLAGRAPC